MNEAWIIDGVRSPRGGGKPGVGSMTHIHPQRILAQVLNALHDRVGFETADVEDVIMGPPQGRTEKGSGEILLTLLLFPATARSRPGPSTGGYRITCPPCLQEKTAAP